MNLRISNLSYQRNMHIKATNSARLFDETDILTTTDATFSLIPGEDLSIEGTLHLVPNDMMVTLATDLNNEQVIVKAGKDREMIIPLEKNIAIELNNNFVGISAY